MIGACKKLQSWPVFANSLPRLAETRLADHVVGNYWIMIQLKAKARLHMHT